MTSPELQSSVILIEQRNMHNNQNNWHEYVEREVSTSSIGSACSPVSPKHRRYQPGLALVRLCLNALLNIQRWECFRFALAFHTQPSGKTPLCCIDTRTLLSYTESKRSYLHACHAERSREFRFLGDRCIALPWIITRYTMVLREVSHVIPRSPTLFSPGYMRSGVSLGGNLRK